VVFLKIIYKTIIQLLFNIQVLCISIMQIIYLIYSY